MKHHLFSIGSKAILLFALALLACSPAVTNAQTALTYPIVDTGQTRCYNNTQQIACPSSGAAFFGQDAQYVGNTPSYQNNGDGTIADLNTGLQWQKTPGNKVTFANAVAGAKSLNLGGYSDWRLQNHS
jgi:hypothetical protein